jgi:AraC-like DNA-binding protein
VDLATGSRLSLRVESIDVARVAWSAPASDAAHEHDQRRIVIALRGHFREQRGGRGYEHRPGAILVRDARVAHSDRYDQRGGAYISIAFHDECALPPCDPAWYPQGVPTVTRLASQLAAEIVRADAWSPLAVHGLTLELVAALGRRTGADRTRPRWLDEVCTALREDRRRRWSLADVGELAGIDPGPLSRAVRRFTGLTVGAYVRALRVDEARSLIESSGMPLSAIATDTGFSDQSHLNRAFRRAFGTSPAQHRRNARFVSLRSKKSGPF